MSEAINVCAIDRGLHFLRNWFKNKIPHHPAPHMWGLFLWFLDKVSLKLLFDKKSYSLTTLPMHNKNEFNLITNQPDLAFLNTNSLKFSINLKKNFYGFNQ